MRKEVAKMKKFVLLLIVPVALVLGVQTATAQQKATSSVESNWNSFRTETLSGTITMVQPGAKAVYVEGSGGVSFQFLVTNKTRIEVDGAKATIDDLANQTQKQVTVTFVARPNGDMAHSITVSG